MAMRDLITGGAACAVPGGAASSANPFGALANAVLGSSSKAQELKGLPGAAINVPSSSSEFRPEFPLTTIPGSEHESERYQQGDARGSEFLNSFRSADNGGLADAWGEIYQPHTLQPQSREGPPQRVLSQFLHSFVNSGCAGVPFRPAALPVLGLSESDKQCIRDRSCIISRHIFSDKSEEYISAQVNSLLHSLDIDSSQHLRGPVRGHYPELEEYWNESQGVIRTGRPSLPDGWVSEFGQQSEHGNPDAWVHSFDQMHGANDWASEFEQSQFASSSHIMRGVPGFAAMEQSRMFGHALVQNTDPKFQNSKFLQFVPKMSHGELFIDENQIKPATGSLSDTWAEEYQNQYNATPKSWADQFARQEILHETNTWVKEYEMEPQAVDDEWVSEFSKMHVQDWADEFGQQVAEGAFGESSVNDWADGYERFMEEQVLASKQQSKAGIYVFSDMNPYVGHPNPLKEGKELFHKGLLSEAVLALEAEVLKNSDNAEGWRLLGITHAENDDDQQAIAAMMRAHESDPSNLEVLLALGVSHTNELDQKEALSYLHRWLQNHTKYGHLVSAGSSGSLYHGDVTRLFNEAAEMSPEDADLHIVLGVLYNLSREYDKAIDSFKRALQFKPQDYSLWNKLGATQANSIHSADAILAYQQALDLKPNYVRAWANMGISYSNQGLYDDSIRYYVRALAMNPKADNVWQYLRISLSVSSRNDMFQACDSRNLDALQKEFPL